jgi:tetratricopeptide (TPR) repeat protein
MGAIFFSDYWGEVGSGLYRPLTILSYALNMVLVGPGAWGFHAVNVTLHACNALLLFGFLPSLGLSRRTAWLAALLFAVHPLNTESVNMVVGRAELLVVFFVLLGLRTARIRHPLWTFLTGLSYFAGLLSKEHAVTFCAILVLVDLFEAGRKEGMRERLRERMSLYALLAVITGLWLLLRSGVLVMDQPLPPVDNPLVLAPLATRILTALKVQLLYFWKLLVPLRLQAIYTGASVSLVESVFSPWTVTVAVALAGSACLAAYGWAKGRAYGLGILLYAVSFSVTANILFPTAVLMAERFAYLPSAWFCLSLVSIVTGAATGENRRGWQGKGAVMVLASVGSLFLVQTVNRNWDYRSPSRLWESTVATDPRNVKAWMALAESYWEEGRGQEAERALVSATESDPSFPDSYALLGEYRLRLGKPAEAIEAARKGGGGPLANLVLARGHLLLGRPEEALMWLSRMRPVASLRHEYWLTKGEALGKTGDYEGAAAAYDQLKGSAAYREVVILHGLALLRLGRSQDAEGVLRYAAREIPTARAFNLLGVSLASQGKTKEARGFFLKAVELDPHSSEYRNNYERSAVPQR